MANRNVKLKNKSGDYLYPYTDNIPTATTSKAGIVKLDSSPTANSNNAITSGAVNTAINTVNTNLSNKLGKTETAAKATADANGNNIATTYLTKTETAAKATADAEGNNISSTYLKKSEEGRGGLNLLVRELQKACAWTWTQNFSGGSAQILLNANGSVSDGVSCSSVGGVGYTTVVYNRKLYKYNSTTGALTQEGTESTWDTTGYGVAINNGKLYSFFSSKYVDTGTQWTYVGMGYFGIKNGTLCRFTNQSTLLWYTLDNAGTWNKIVSTQSGSTWGIRDTYPYYITTTTPYGTSTTTLTRLSSENGFSCVSIYNSVGIFSKQSRFFIYGSNGTLSRSGDLGANIVKLAGYYALTSDGKLYNINSNNPPLMAENVIDICLSGYIKSDGYYNYSHTKLVNGTFTNIVHSDNTYGAPNAVLFAGSGNIQQRTVYTTPNPAANYKSFVGLNLTGQDTITSVASGTITNSSHTFSRDIGKDDYFTQPPDDLRKQTPTKWDLIDLIQNAQ